MPGDTHVRYRPAAPGGWWAACEGTAVAVLAPAVTETTVTAVWRRVGGGGIGAVLEALTGAFGTSLSAIPPFALAVAEPGGVRVAVRGALAVLVEGASAAEEISGEGVATWTERFVAGAVRVSIEPGSAPAASGALLVPLVSGVAVSDLVVMDLAGASTSASPASSSGGTAADLPTDAAAPERADGAEAAPADAPSPEADAPSPEAVAPDAADEASVPSDAAPDAGADTLLPMTTAAPVGEQPVDEYDLLWGETVARPIAAAAVTPAEGSPETDAPEPAGPAPDVASLADAERAPLASVPAEIRSPADRDAAARTAEAPISSEPTAAAAPVLPPVSAASALGDHDGETIAVADLRAMRQAQRETFESTDNVPSRVPARGRIRLSTGRVVELERPVVIGRRPKSTRTSGAELPTLVAVDSPDQDISRSHVEIRAEGEHVLVTDLDTTNGTVLLRGGQDPVRLHPGEPTMVITGDVLDIGDGVTIAFEDLP